ncbi:PEP-CTERM sorting domain-containing protein [Pontiella sulfatireligans]|uniref:PEP-CTERM protein-sorting domain-containing protein n=1 Tax=Pontiella sulfatireligans TaxID=2750658 RepID=A0A6C2UGS6_9BACT|nr:PEP-CTERM sorting domain-containing protein [Pontiella sulfatireligans]VGO19328.1 hypothetical protein SCARR_01386 [Pontiella sulfatireligans]
MKQKKPVTLLYAIIMTGFVSSASAALFTEDFEGGGLNITNAGNGALVLGIDYAIGDLIHADQANMGVIATSLDASNGFTVDSGGNARACGLIIDATAFTGSGLSLNFDSLLVTAGTNAYYSVWGVNSTDPVKIDLGKATDGFVSVVGAGAQDQLIADTVFTHGATITSAAFDSTGHDTLVVLFTANGNEEFVIDNVSVIPEPATLGLVATTGFALLLVRRKFML